MRYEIIDRSTGESLGIYVAKNELDAYLGLCADAGYKIVEVGEAVGNFEDSHSPELQGASTK